MDCTQELPQEVINGIHLFNRGCFFEAHEELETAWRKELKPNRNLYQGILQLGVGYYHLMRGNFVGARKLFTRAEKTLEEIPSPCQGINVALVRKQIIEARLIMQRIESNPHVKCHFPLYPIEIGQTNYEQSA
jgi:uncharacterized protein